MTDFFIYAIESAICLGVLYLPYRCFFRITTFHQANRCYLWIALSFALLAPHGNFSILPEVKQTWQPLDASLQALRDVPHSLVAPEIPDIQPEPVAYAQPQATVPTPESGKTRSVGWIWSAAYWLGLVLSMLLFGFRLGRLWQLTRKGTKSLHNGMLEVRVTGLDKKIFSFLHMVFLDRKCFSENELAILLAHEQVHYHQKHSVDLLIISMLQCVFWFNPLLWLYRSALQDEHEYFTDSHVAKQTGKKAYAQSLLDLAVQKRPILGHAFAYVPIRHRILKLVQKPSHTMKKSRYFIALPFFGCLFLLFACSNDPLELLEASLAPKGQLVQKVEAFYEPYALDLIEGSGKSLGWYSFMQNGLIDRVERKSHPVFKFSNLNPHMAFGRSPSAFIPKEHAANFYAKRVQWLLVNEALLKEHSFYEGLLFLEDLSAFIESGSSTSNATYFQQANGVDAFTAQVANIPDAQIIRDAAGNVTSLSRNYEIESEPFTSRHELRYESAGKVAFWSTDIASEGGVTKFKNVTVRRYPTKNHKSMKVEYGAHGKPDKVTFKQQLTYDINGAVVMEKKLPFKNNENPKAMELYFTYNAQGQMETMALHKRGMLLRSYEYEYNQQGLCTKQILLNRYGKRELGVRYEYTFYEAEKAQ